MNVENKLSDVKEVLENYFKVPRQGAINYMSGANI
jgi:hypothetical protein